MSSSFDVLEWMGGLSKDTKGRPQFPDKLAERFLRVTDTMRHLATEGAKGVKGKVTVEFDMEIVGDQLAISTKISSKEPAEALETSTSYFGPDGRLCDLNPKQYQFEFRGAAENGKGDPKGPGGNGAAKGAGGNGEIKSPER